MLVYQAPFYSVFYYRSLFDVFYITLDYDNMQERL